MNKKELRSLYLEKRLALDEEQRLQLSQKIQALIIEKLQELSKGAKVGLYSPVKNEVDISKVFEVCLKEGLVAYYPKVEQGIYFYQVDSQDQLEKGAWGVLEPHSDSKALKSDENLDLLLVPGIVFDKKGYRIGYGKAFYDRFLKDNHCQSIGVAYDFQVVDQIGHDAWDQKLNAVISEKGLYQ